MIKIFRALIGVFTFRRAEIARLHLAQQMDAEGMTPIDDPFTETMPSGFVVLKQKAIRSREWMKGTRND